MAEVRVVSTDEKDVYGVVVRATKQVLLLACKDESIMRMVLDDVRRSIGNHRTIFEVESNE